MKYSQLIGNQYPCSVFAPFSEVPIHSLPGRKAFGQIPPDNAVFGQVKDGFYNTVEGPDAFSFDANKFFDGSPLRYLAIERPSGRRNKVASHNLNPDWRLSRFRKTLTQTAS